MRKKPFNFLLMTLSRILVKICFYNIETLKMHLATPRIRGPRERLRVGKSCSLQNAVCNTVSGSITFKDYVFCGENCMFLTGKHDYTLTNLERQQHPDSGFDIEVGQGVWICSGAIILGGVKIADHAVIGAGAVVTQDCNAAGVYLGVPARLHHLITFKELGTAPSGGGKI